MHEIIHIAEIGPGKQPVAPLAAEDQPAAVARPEVPGVGLLTVDVDK